MFKNALRRALAIPVMALGLAAGLVSPAAADVNDDFVEVTMIWDGTEASVRDVGVNIFGDDNVVVPGDSGESTLRIVNAGTNPSTGIITVELVDVYLTAEHADDVYDFLTVNDVSAAQIRADYVSGDPVVVVPPTEIPLDDEFLVDFNWEMPIVRSRDRTPGNVAQVGVAREVTFVVRLTITGDTPADPTPTPPGTPPKTWTPPPCPPQGPCTRPPHHGGHPPVRDGILAETGGFLVQQPMWLWGLAALAIATVIGYARKRPAEQQQNG